jgi:hypothetical protein
VKEGYAHCVKTIYGRRVTANLNIFFLPAFRFSPFAPALMPLEEPFRF